MTEKTVSKKHLIYLVAFLMIATWSRIDAFEPTLWLLEAGICIVALAILMLTYKRFKFTELSYAFIFLHMIILFVGAHYSYARVPVFDYLAELFNHSRNNFDKLGHFAQGFVPALIARELIVRLNIVNKKGWIPFFVICISLAISAFYELLEWWVAVLSNDGAEEFLGMQGYEWDTQSDIFFALIGAIFMLALFSGIQDRAIDKIEGGFLDKDKKDIYIASNENL